MLFSESEVVYNCQHMDFKSQVSATVRALFVSNIYCSIVFSLLDEVGVQLMVQCVLVQLLEVYLCTTVMFF